MKFKILLLAGLLALVPASVNAGTLRNLVNAHQASHGEGTMTQAQWEAYRDRVDGSTIDWEVVEVYNVDCEKDHCSVSAFPVPKGNDFLPRITKKVPRDFGMGLARGDTIKVKGEIDILDFLIFNVTVK